MITTAPCECYKNHCNALHQAAGLLTCAHLSPHLLRVAAPQCPHAALVVRQHAAEGDAKVLVQLDNLLVHSTEPAGRTQWINCGRKHNNRRCSSWQTLPTQHTGSDMLLQV